MARTDTINYWLLILTILVVNVLNLLTATTDTGAISDSDDKDFRFITHQGKFLLFLVFHYINKYEY